MSTTTTSFHPRLIVFDLLTALLDSWTLWDASTPNQSKIDGRQWRTRYLELTFNCGAYQPYEGLVRQSAEDVGLPSSTAQKLLQNWDNLKIWPDVPDVLNKLRNKGVLLGVVTNCSMELGSQAVSLVESQAGVKFDASVTAEESRFYKPRKEAYDALLSRLDISSDQVLFVAGSAGDVQGATDAGMKVVWHNRVGLDRKGNAVPLREGATLEETLEEFL